MAARLLLGLLAALAAFAAGAPLAYAAPAPSVVLNDVQAFRNIVGSANLGDIVIIARYELPLGSSTSTGWCPQLHNTAGCDADPILPTEPTSLEQGDAFVVFYDDASLTLIAKLDELPRIGHGLAGLYFGAGHGLTWGSADYRVCIESSPTAYDLPVQQSCLSITWDVESGGSGVLATRTALGTALVGMVRDLESVLLVPLGTFVRNGLITPSGQVYTEEAFSEADRFAPGFFATGASTVGRADYSTPVSNVGLQATIEANPTAIALRATIDGASDQFLGFDGDRALMFISFGGGLMLAGVIGGALRSVPGAGGGAALGFFAPLFVTSFLSAPPLYALISVLLLLSIFPIALIGKKVFT